MTKGFSTLIVVYVAKIWPIMAIDNADGRHFGSALSQTGCALQE
jgi:hypothetical protein